AGGESDKMMPMHELVQRSVCQAISFSAAGTHCSARWRALMLGSPVLGKSSWAHRRPTARVLAAFAMQSYWVEWSGCHSTPPIGSTSEYPPREYYKRCRTMGGLL